MKKYRVIVADPPWHFKSNSRAKPGRNPMRHYDCMSLVEIAALDIEQYAADESGLFLWIPGPLLAVGAHIDVMHYWGFKPSGIAFVWIKTNKNGSLFTGSGFTTRKNAEFCLLGKRGRSIRRDNSVHEVIIEGRREHSRKPEQFYQRVMQYAAGPYLELFARQKRKGWTCVGDQVDKFSS